MTSALKLPLPPVSSLHLSLSLSLMLPQHPSCSRRILHRLAARMVRTVNMTAVHYRYTVGISLHSIYGSPIYTAGTFQVYLYTLQEAVICTLQVHLYTV